MNKIPAVIIDDEDSNRELIRSLIVQLSDAYAIIGEAANVKQGFSLINTLKPMVVFLDIRMPDGTGFDLLRQFSTIDFDVVFISGFDEYALKAFEHNALDYVLKPINFNKFKETLKKVETRITSDIRHLADIQDVLQSYDHNGTSIVKIPIHHKGNVFLLDIHDIMYVKSDEGSTIFHTVKFEKYVSSKKLSSFAFILESFCNILKISRGCYININCIESYSKGLMSYVTLKDGSVHELPRRKKTMIIDALSATANGKLEK